MSALIEKVKGTKITPKDVFSIVYHDKFDYPLTLAELNRWKLGNYLTINSNHSVEIKGNYIFVEGKGDSIIKRTLRERTSLKKMSLAKKAARIISLVPSVKFVGVTGSLAMLNADLDSDIDLIVVTAKDTLWATRLISYLLLKFKKIKIRRAGESLEKDRLCLNMWLDISSLSWKKRNIFTAHEIAQMVPLYDSEDTYKKFLRKNFWIREYWPNAIGSQKAIKRKSVNGFANSFFVAFIGLFEAVAYALQFYYMKSKITHEQISKNKAIFHPIDWSKFVLNQLSS